ncbi:hypothetical protein [Agrococcus sp. Marseille-P2731]|uniref:hypothetical protein n=1 Tax=Agrococcus sp. Marseille-P2731 TaxID=1841862 RepID=UPI0009317D16|nr:hypothetical protein [Agrococcus sp. Marseille-P2731]
MRPFLLLATATPAPTAPAPTGDAGTDAWVTPVVALLSVLLGSAVAPFFIELWKRVLDDWRMVRAERRAGVERILAAALDLMDADREDHEAFSRAKKRLITAIHTLDLGDEEWGKTSGVQGRLLACVSLADGADPAIDPYVNLYGDLMRLRRIIAKPDRSVKITDEIHASLRKSLEEDTAKITSDSKA